MTKQPLDICGQDLYSRKSYEMSMDSQSILFGFLTQPEHSSSNSSVSPLTDEAKILCACGCGELILGCCSYGRRKARYIRGHGAHPKKSNINKELLEELYLIKKCSTAQIAKIFNVSPAVIWRSLRNNNIKLRTISEAKIHDRPINKMIECACGCGTKIWLYNKQWVKQKYTKGHNKTTKGERIRRFNKLKKENFKLICSCGCGEPIELKSFHKYYNIKYIKGHASRLQPKTKWKITPRQCKVCGMNFLPSKNKYQTCSRKCGCKLRKGEHAYKKQEYKCIVCDKSILKTPLKRSKSKYVFCSRRCQSSYLSELYKNPDFNPTMGKGHSQKTKMLLSKMAIYRTQNNKFDGKYFSKKGYREDLGIYVRSTWEADYLRLLNYMNIPWQYEQKTFTFDDCSDGIHSYTPDVFLPILNRYVEIKGYLNEKDKKKLNKFKVGYPEIFKNMIVVLKHNKPKCTEWFSELGITNFVFISELFKKYNDKINFEAKL